MKVGRTGVVFDAVEREVVLGFEVAVRTETVGRGVGHGWIFLNAGFEQGEVRITPAVQGQVANLLLLHDATDVGGLRVQQGRSRLDLDGLRHVADLEVKVERRTRLHVDLDVTDLCAPNPGAVALTVYSPRATP